MGRTIDCAHVLDGNGARIGAQRITLDGDRIKAITPLTSTAREPSLLAMPALANAHDHARAIRGSSFGADGLPLEGWLHLLGLMPSVDPYVAAATSFAQSALGGAGSVMTHYTRAQGFTSLPEEAAIIARAARDVGTRVGFAVCIRDRNPLVYGPKDPVLAALAPEHRQIIEGRLPTSTMKPADFIKLVDDVAAAAHSPNFDVQYGPHGVQWCSDEMLTAIADASSLTGRRVHLHLLETRYQREWADAHYKRGLIRWLDDIGLLSPRLTLAHCLYATQDEYELLAERGVTIAVSNSSNLHLHSGIAPVQRMRKLGIPVGYGIDGKALDDDDDYLRELRLAYLLHAGTGFDASPRSATLGEAIRNGRFSISNVRDDGLLAPGSTADLLLLDWAALDDDQLMQTQDPMNMLFSRATAKHIREVIVGGNSIVRDGKVLGIDFPAVKAELLAQTRHGLQGNEQLSAALHALLPHVAEHYESGAHCC